MTFGTLSQPAPVRRPTMVGRATRSVVRSRHIRAEVEGVVLACVRCLTAH